jgi:hypothetical protein
VALRALAVEARPPLELQLLAAALVPSRCLGGLCERCLLRLRVTQLQEPAAGLSRLQRVPSQYLRLLKHRAPAVEPRRLLVAQSVPT